MILRSSKTVLVFAAALFYSLVVFNNITDVALTLSLLMWLMAFLSVGAEWFLMWQSKDWNGQEAASACSPWSASS
jgi:predicted small integral membrane protein